MSRVQRSTNGRDEPQRRLFRPPFLEEALQHLDQALSVFDGDFRLSFFNRRFLQILDLPPGLVRLGTPFEDLVRFNAERGEYGPGPVDELVRERLELAQRREPHCFERVRRNGTVIEICGAPLPNGGFVTTYTDVTSRRRASTALRESEARYRDLVEMAPDSILVHRDERIIFANSAAAALMGTEDPADLIGRRLRDFVHPNYRMQFLRRLACLERGSAPLPLIEYELVGCDDRRVTVEAVGGPIVLDGKPAIQSILRDITDRKKAEQRLAEAIAHLQEGFALYDADDRLVLFNEEYRNLHADVVDLIVPGVQFRDLVRARAERGMNADALEDPEAHIRDRMARHRNPGDPIVRRMTDGSHYLIRESRTPEGGVVVTQIDITERIRAEQALRESEERFRTLVESTNVIAWELDLATWRFTYVSPHAVGVLGYSLEAWYAENFWSDHIHPEDRDWAVSYCRASAAAGRDHDFEYRMLTADGRTVWLRDIVTVMRDAQQRPVGLRGFMIDITDRKQAEQALRESEERYRNLVEGSIQGILIHREHRPLFANQTFAEIFGYADPDEIMALDSVLSLFVPREHERLLHLDRRHRAEQNLSATYEVEGIRKDGTRIWLENRVHAVTWDGSAACQITSVDITERRRAVQALRESEERFRTVVDNLPSAVFLKDREGRYLLVNKRYRDWYGVTDEQILGKTAYDRFPKHRADLYTADDAHVLRSGQVLHREIESQFPDGAERTTLVSKFPIMGSSGIPTAVGGVETDITRHKQIEAALRESEERFRDVARAASDWIWEMDSLLRFTYFSERLEEITGASRETFLGKRRDEVADISADPENWRRHLEDLEARRPFRDFTYRHVLPDGCVRYFKISGLPLFHPDGTFKGYRGTGTDITAEVEARRRAEFLANYDQLTGLPNLTLFSDRVLQAMAQARRPSPLLAVLSLGVDRFRTIVETLGHRAGDQVLKEVSRRLKDCIAGGDALGRVGNQFLVLLGNVEDVESLGGRLRRLGERIGNPIELLGEHLHVTVSIGVAVYPGDGADPDTLIRNADTAYHRARAQGPGSSQFYTADMNEKARIRLSIETRLRKALEQDQLVLHYQPQVRLDDGRLTGVEALVRWPDAGGRLMAPSDFIPLAEESGLIVPIGELVLDKACRQARQWEESGLPPIDIAVNVSSRQLLDGRIADIVRRVLDDTGLAPQRLKLEITESTLMADVDTTERIMRAFQDLGIRLAIDDFGTGYSSLSYLNRFPVDTLKVDRSFVVTMVAEPRNAAIVHAIVGLAHSLEMRVIAEGVDAEEQLSYLREYGCDAIQGFLVSPPLPPSEIKPFFPMATHEG